uniref:Uncharacterized protein n=1 Tax=Pararge aegeria TaxID=116150 RepID=S4PER5_9NEOP
MFAHAREMMVKVLSLPHEENVSVAVECLNRGPLMQPFQYYEFTSIYILNNVPLNLILYVFLTRGNTTAVLITYLYQSCRPLIMLRGN